jgi:hypothetical protein
MGGVDLLDSLLGLYRIHIRSKKWYHRLFFHMLDVIICNAWLLYSVETTYGINSVISKLMTLVENAETGQFLFLIVLI